MVSQSSSDTQADHCDLAKPRLTLREWQNQGSRPLPNPRLSVVHRMFFTELLGLLSLLPRLYVTLFWEPSSAFSWVGYFKLVDGRVHGFIVWKTPVIHWKSAQTLSGWFEYPPDLWMSISLIVSGCSSTLDIALKFLLGGGEVCASDNFTMLIIQNFRHGPSHKFPDVFYHN